MCIFFFVIIDKTRPWTLLTHAQNLLLQEALLWNQIFVLERDLSCICTPISNWIITSFFSRTYRWALLVLLSIVSKAV